MLLEAPKIESRAMKAPPFLLAQLLPLGAGEAVQARVRQWLGRRLGVPSEAVGGQERKQDSVSAGVSPAPPSAAPRASEGPAADGTGAAIPAAAGEASGPLHAASAASLQVHAVSGRFDRLVEQLELIEAAVDRVAERQMSREFRERRQGQRVTELLDRLADAQEGQADSLALLSRRMDRLERRVLWAERGSGLALAQDLPPGPSSREPRSPETLVPPSATQRVARDAARSSGDSSSPFGGTLIDISLPTLLSMAELERWTGRLSIEAKSRTVLVDWADGLLVGVFEDDSPSDAVTALYDLVEAREGRYRFTPLPTVTKTELAPMTVGTLMLRVGHRRDELRRADVGV